MLRKLISLGISLTTTIFAMHGTMADDTYTSPRERFTVQVPFQDLKVQDGDRAPGLGHDSVTFTHTSKRGVGHRIEYLGAPFKSDREFYATMSDNATSHRGSDADASVESRERLMINGRAAYRVTMSGDHATGKITVIATYLLTEDGMIATSSWAPQGTEITSEHDTLLNSIG
jgi:hypothetical protein